MTNTPGLGGSLFPSQYLVERVLHDAVDPDARSTERVRRELPRWWTRVASTCGPATGLRALFDVAAMPLFGLLGFRASHAVFDRHSARARLQTRAGTPVSLLIRPWAARRPAAWRSSAVAGQQDDAAWCIVFAPPYVSLVPTRGAAMRRSFDVTLPDACCEESLVRLVRVLQARMFDAAPAGTPIDVLVKAGAAFQERVRADLQLGVIRALTALAPVLDHRFEEALTVLYRILFLLFAESRGLMPQHHPVYRDAYAMTTLCRQAAAAGVAPGLWDGLAAVTRLSRSGCRTEDLVVSPFNGRLFAKASAPALEAGHGRGPASARARRRDEALQSALVALATRSASGGRQDICYADLGVEQLGAVYERVLDLEPGRQHQRKQTGTFYTPRALTEFVVRQTLRPLVAGRTSDQILELRVVDPAMGSGAFLVAACRYLAAAYERALVDEGVCSESDIGGDERAGFRRVVAERCLAGVDANPVAVQLARLSLWLATLSAGKPLGFLDHRLRTGNSLIGVRPDDLRRVPEARASRPAGLPLFAADMLERSLRDAVVPLSSLLHRGDESVGDVRAKETAWARLCAPGSPLAPWRQAAHLWCARWFWPDRAPTRSGRTEQAGPSSAEIRAGIDAVLHGDRTLPAAQLARLLDVSAMAADAHGFFHWPLEFADIFYDSEGRPRSRPGFDAVVGNPPWEMLRDDHRATSILRFVRESGAYPSCARGHLNLYQPFLERAMELTRTDGRIGLLLPWSVATDEGAAALRRRLFEGTTLDTLTGFDNARGLFPIHRGLRFVSVITTNGGATEHFSARFGVKTREEIAALPGAMLPLSRAGIERAGGPGLRIPDVRRVEEMNLLDRAVRTFPRLGAADGWHAAFGRELNVTEDRASFTDEGVPVLEGKHVAPFEAALSEGHRIPPSILRDRFPRGEYLLPRLAYRDVSAVGNKWSLIAAIVPAHTITTHTLFCLRTALPIERQHFLCALFNSYVLNAMVRLWMGTHVTTGLVESLPVPAWRETPLFTRIAALGERRARGPGLRGTAAVLQALVARLYGIDRQTFTAMLTGFPLVAPGEREAALRAFERIARIDAL